MCVCSALCCGSLQHRWVFPVWYWMRFLLFDLGALMYVSGLCVHIAVYDVCVWAVRLG